jgi:heptosyltransferase-2
MKILCICPIGIGNYILVYPACSYLHKILPDAKLHLLALRAPISGLAQGDSLWEKIHCIDPTKKQPVSKILSFFKELRSERFDISINLFPSNNWQYNLLPFLSAIPQRFAFSYNLKKIASLSFFGNRKMAVDPLLHDIDQNLKLVSHFFGSDSYQNEFCFPQLFTEQDKSLCLSMLGDSGKQIKIGIHPGSSGEHGMDAKRWAPEKFGRLADLICEKLDAEALIFGGPDESELKRQTSGSMKRQNRIIENVSLRLTSALIHECKLMLCNDSGLMHIAAASGVPVISLFGPTDERRNGPYGSGHLILRKQMTGFPLWTAQNVGSRKVPEGIDPQASLNALTPEEAWESVLPWLNSRF